jgi:hypothetical protein
MSLGTQTETPETPETPGSSAPGVAGGGTATNPGDAASRLLGRLSVLPALLVMAWLLAGLPLLLAGRFTLALMLVVSIPLAVVLVVLGLRWIPGRWQGARPVLNPEPTRTPWWAVAGVIVVAVAFGVDQMIYHSQFIIVTRDPASYVNFGYWIAHHGSLPIPQDSAAFGGTHHVLRFDGFAYYQVGSTVVPQFMAGLPMVLAGAFWIGGVNAAAAAAPLLGACAVLTFGGLVARLVGPRWAPLAALVLALSLPEQFTSRSDYSEVVTQILFLGGICLVIDSLEADGIGARVVAALGGLALGLTLLVRIDGASDILPLVPYCGLLLVARRRQALPLLGGLVVGGLYGAIDGAVLSRPYLQSIKTSLIPLVLVAGLVVIATALGVALIWRRGLPQVRGTWLPNAVAALAVLVTVAFTLRPYVQTVRAGGTKAYLAAMAGYQRANHLPVDPTRLYYEISLHWVFWYVGVPVVALATLAAALLSRRCLRGRAPTWTLPLLIFAWTIIVTLYRPGITPDQPWASRRLVPAVLPGFILLAVWGSSWLLGWIRRTGIDRVIYLGLAACCLAALVLPAAVTTFGVGVKHGGPVGIRLAASGLAFKRTYEGEIGAVSGMCAAIPRGSSVVFVDGSDADLLIQVVRGMCGEPTARLNAPTVAAVRQVVRGIVQAGRRPVLLAADKAELRRYGGPMKQIVRLRTTMDESSLTTAPRGTWRFALNVWMSEPSP